MTWVIPLAANLVQSSRKVYQKACKCVYVGVFRGTKALNAFRAILVESVKFMRQQSGLSAYAKEIDTD